MEFPLTARMLLRFCRSIPLTTRLDLFLRTVPGMDYNLQPRFFPPGSWPWHSWQSGQIIAGPSHDLGPQKVAKEGKSPYFREI